MTPIAIRREVTHYYSKDNPCQQLRATQLRAQRHALHSNSLRRWLQLVQSIFKHYPDWKWLNLQSFFAALRPHEEILNVKLFSALIDPENPTSEARERQARYFAALQTLPKVKIILGKFQPRQVHCQATCKEQYVIPEEKKTDVNIAVEMMSDALAARCDRMYLVSGDSDIQPAVEWISANRQSIKITVYIPALENEQIGRRTDYYRTKKLPVECKFLPLADIKNHQLPRIVKSQDGKLIARPHTWCRAEPQPR